MKQTYFVCLLSFLVMFVAATDSQIHTSFGENKEHIKIKVPHRSPNLQIIFQSKPPKTIKNYYKIKPGYKYTNNGEEGLFEILNFTEDKEGRYDFYFSYLVSDGIVSNFEKYSIYLLFNGTSSDEIEDKQTLIPINSTTESNKTMLKIQKYEADKLKSGVGRFKKQLRADYLEKTTERNKIFSTNLTKKDPFMTSMITNNLFIANMIIFVVILVVVLLLIIYRFKIKSKKLKWESEKNEEMKLAEITTSGDNDGVEVSDYEEIKDNRYEKLKKVKSLKDMHEECVLVDESAYEDIDDHKRESLYENMIKISF